jgi:hypothetical protein
VDDVLLQSTLRDDMHGLVRTFIQVPVDIKAMARTTAPACDTGLTVGIAVVSARVDGFTARELRRASVVVTYIVVVLAVGVLIMLFAVLIDGNFLMPTTIPLPDLLAMWKR